MSENMFDFWDYRTVEKIRAVSGVAIVVVSLPLFYLAVEIALQSGNLPAAAALALLYKMLTDAYGWLSDELDGAATVT